MLTAREALARLQEGNRRFAAGEAGRHPHLDPEHRRELVDGQEPFAIVLGCSDSRVPAELVFDQGVGDLFVVRVAGNIVSPSPLGSVEFAADHLGTRLVVVMGHSRCGAIQATVNELQRPTPGISPSLQAIVDRIRPCVEPLLAEAGPSAASVEDAGGEKAHGTEADAEAADGAALIARAVRANVRAATHALRHESPVLERLVREEGLLVVGAEYSLRTGIVEFFEGMPGAE